MYRSQKLGIRTIGKVSISESPLWSLTAHTWMGCWPGLLTGVVDAVDRMNLAEITDCKTETLYAS